MSLRTKIFIILLTASLISLSHPQSIRNIDISGNHIFGKQEIIEWSRLSKGDKVFENLPDSAKKGISINLAQRGYFYPEILISMVTEERDSSQSDIKIFIDEGKNTVVRTIHIENSDSMDALTQNMFSFLLYQTFNKSEIEENINNWLNNLENTGYPFAKAKVVSVQVTDDSAGDSFADVSVQFEHGQYSRINKVMISGNTSTKDFVIIRELRLNRNQLYSQKEIDELPKRLNRLRFFELVNVPDFYLDNNNDGVLLVNVKEKQTNNFDGIIGYMPGTGTDQKGYFTGLVNINLRNLFGTGRAAAVRWQQYDRYSQEMELRYLEPWIFSYPFNITAGLFQRKQDTTFIQRRFEAALEFLATQDISAGITISTERVIPSLREVPRFTVFNSNAFTTGVTLKIDTRDDPYSPLEGFLLFNSYGFSRKKLYGPQEYFTPSTQKNFNLQRFTLDFSIYFQMFSRQVLALGVHGRELRGSFFEQSDLYRLGGTNTLRGFRENQFLGSRIFWSNTEYRFLLSRRTFVFLFFDTGYYLINQNTGTGIPENEAFNKGYGAGLNIETGIGVLAVSYALAADDRFSKGKIHFGIVNEF